MKQNSPPTNGQTRRGHGRQRRHLHVHRPPLFKTLVMCLLAGLMQARAVHAAAAGDAYMLLMLDLTDSIYSRGAVLRGRAFTAGQDTPMETTGEWCPPGWEVMCYPKKLPLLFPTPYQRDFDPSNLKKGISAWNDGWNDNLNYYYEYQSGFISSSFQPLLVGADDGSSTYTFALRMIRECPPDAAQEDSAVCSSYGNNYYGGLHRVVISAEDGMPDYEATVAAPLFYVYLDRESDNAEDRIFSLSPDGTTLCDQVSCIYDALAGAGPATLLPNTETHDTRTRKAYYEEANFDQSATPFLAPNSTDLWQQHGVYQEQKASDDSMETLSVGWDDAGACRVYGHEPSPTLLASVQYGNVNWHEPSWLEGMGKAPGGTRFSYHSRLSAFVWVGADYRVYAHSWRNDTNRVLAAFPVDNYTDPTRLYFSPSWTAPASLDSDDYVYLSVVDFSDSARRDIGGGTYCIHTIWRLAFSGGNRDGESPLLIVRTNGRCRERGAGDFAVLPLARVGYTGYQALHSGDSSGDSSGDNMRVHTFVLWICLLLLVWL